MDNGGFTLGACHHLLRPVIRILLRGGVGWREFAECAKRVFVEVAREDYGIKGRPTNLTRVAMMTGLSRREVGAIRKELEGPADAAIPTPPASRISRVLSGWFQNWEFLDASGHPLELVPRGPAPSFSALLKRYAGDIPASALEKEMKAIKVVEETEYGKFRVLSRHYLRSGLDPDIVRQMGVALHDHAHTLAHNLDTQRGGPPRFEGVTSNDRMPASTSGRLSALAEMKGQRLLEEIDDWLTTHELAGEANGDSDQEPHRMGVGVYFFEYPRNNE